MIMFDEAKIQLIYDSKHYFWCVEINQVSKQIKRKVSPDCPDSATEILENIKNFSGHKLKNYQTNEIQFEAGIGVEIRKLIISRSLSIGKIERQPPSIETLKNSFVISVVRGYNCLGYPDC